MMLATLPKPKTKLDTIPERIRAAFAARCVTLTVPRGEDGYWMLIRYLDGRGGFTRDEVKRRLPDDGARQSFDVYMDALIRAGFVSPAGTGLHRVTRKQVEAPRLTQAGRQKVHATRQSYLWRAMKMLGFFSVDDLVVAASSPDLEITSIFAASYADELAAAGYLLSRNERGRMLYRLRPAMNTGPAAPQVLRARFVWDPNLCRVVGEATRIDEVR